VHSDFDHAAFDPKTRRVFIAHAARDCIEVIDHDAKRHIATLPGLPGVAGAVADDGDILTTNRGAATITWLDAATYEVKGVFPSGRQPNGAAIVKHLGLGIAACIGDADQGPVLQTINLKVWPSLLSQSTSLRVMPSASAQHRPRLLCRLSNQGFSGELA